MDDERRTPSDDIVLDGSVVNRDKETISLELYPGAVIDVKMGDVARLEEGTDAVSGRAIVRIALNPNAELKGTFTPRLLRLALSRDVSRIPFALGGMEDPTLDPGAMFPTFSAREAGTGPGGGYGGQPTITEKRSKSRHPIWGWVNDDVILTDKSAPV